MKTPMKHLSYLLPALLAAPSAATPPPDSPFGGAPSARYGQVRTRTEYDAKAMADTSANKALLSTQLRTRLGFTSANSPVGFKIEFQDSRFFGQEPAAAANPATASLGNMKGVDLLQGYVTVEHGGTRLALGRQKMSLGSGRFLSTLEWHPYSRAFDGLSFNAEMEPGNLTGLAYLVSDASAAAPDDYDLLTGLFYNHKFTLNLSADVYAFYDKSTLPSAVAGVAAANSDLVYVGERIAGKAGPITFEEEFIWQAGELHAGRDLASQAFMLALRLGSSFGKHKVNLGLDMMSGDDDPADDVMRTYRPNYYFGHAYFGWMDYFLGNPAHGVIDIRADMDLGFLPNPAGAPTVSLKPQYHFFLPQSAPSASDDPYGQEIDVELHLTGIYPKANLVLGAGLFLPGDGAFKLPAARLAAGQDSKPGLFLYFMPIFNF
jgi:hypothetical protein